MIEGHRPVIAATDGPVPNRNPFCHACGYPYSGLGLCGWCRSVDVLRTHRVIGRSGQDTIENTVLGLETLDDIAILTAMLNPPVNSARS
jgi:hypothetical protein